MRKIIEILEMAIPFLAAYPLWVKSLVALWILFAATLLIILLFSRSERNADTVLTQKEPIIQQEVTGSNNTQIGINGGNNSITINPSKDTILLEPVVEVDFEIDNFTKKYVFRILNDGPISIHEIHIEMHSLLFNATIKKNIVAIKPKQEWNLIKNTKRPSDWRFIQKLDTGNNITFNIPYEDLTNTYMLIPGHEVLTKDSLIAIQFFYITYRRMPDRKFYSLGKYLYVNKDKEKDILIVRDLDKIGPDDFVELKRYYENYYKDRLR